MSFDNQQSISDTMKSILTIEDVNMVVQRYANDKCIRVLNYNISEYSNDKLGLTASHEMLKVEFQRSHANESESSSFFVKSIPNDNQVQIALLVDGGLFLKESNFFRQIIPKLNEYCKFESWYPECYFVKKDAIVLEDLKLRNYGLIDVIDNVVAIKSALVSLAQLHGSSIIMENRLNRNSERQITLQDFYPDTFCESIFTFNGVIADAGARSFGVSCILAEKFGYNPDKFRNISYRAYELIKQSDTHRNVICHGDLWSNNMMFNENYECILVDFQHVRYAPLVTDLLQLFHLNTTKSFRANYEKELVEFYRSALDRIIKINDTTDNVKIPTIEDIFLAMNDLRLVGLATACFYFPIVLIDVNISTEYRKDAESYENFMLGSELKRFFDYMEIDDRYKSRLEEAVVELAEHIELFYN